MQREGRKEDDDDVATEEEEERESTCGPVVLVHGVFGAGKSYLCVALVIFIREYIVQRYHKLRKQDQKKQYPAAADVRIMIAASTNVAVDGLLSSLLKHGFTDFVRVGSTKRIAQDIKKKEHKGTNAIRHSVVGVTCASVMSKTCLSRNDAASFDILFLDECSQMIEPQSLLPITSSRCSKMVMVGDPMQLPPVTRSSDVVTTSSSSSSTSSTNPGLEQAMFVRLSRTTSPVLLRTQYRCHPTICNLSSELFYDGRLKSGVTASSRQPLVRLSPLTAYNCTDYGSEARKSMPPVGSSYENHFEATCIVQMIQKLILDNVEPNDIGVIAMFRAQAQLIELKLEKLNIPSLLLERDERRVESERQQRERESRSDVVVLSDDDEEDEEDEDEAADETEVNNGKRKRSSAGKEKKKKKKKKAAAAAAAAAAAVTKKKSKRKVQKKINIKKKTKPMGKKQLQQRCHIKVSTVDAFQGAEREVILLSTTRTNLGNSSSSSSSSDLDTNHLTSPHRLCVALTRAKRHLVLFGHLNTLHRHGGATWKTIIDRLHNQRLIVGTTRDGILTSSSSTAAPKSKMEVMTKPEKEEKEVMTKKQLKTKPEKEEIKKQPVKQQPAVEVLLQSVSPVQEGTTSSLEAVVVATGVIDKLSSNDAESLLFSLSSDEDDEDEDDEDDPFSVDDDDEEEEDDESEGEDESEDEGEDSYRKRKIAKRVVNELDSDDSYDDDSQGKRIDAAFAQVPSDVEDSDDEADSLLSINVFGKE